VHSSTRLPSVAYPFDMGARMSYHLLVSYY
jgi:hypothetical protein